MTKSARILVAVLAIALFMGVAFAQQKAGTQKTPSSSDSKRKDTAEPVATSNKLSPVQQQALLIIESLSNQVNYVDDGSLKIKIQARLADAIWRHDEPRARNQFIDAFHAIDAIKIPSDQNTRHQDFHGQSLITPKVMLRQEVLRLIVRHDLKLAETLRQTIQRQDDEKIESKDKPEKVKPESASPKMPSEQDLQWMQLVISLAKSEPAQASKLVREAFRKGISEVIAYTLIGVRHEKPELADELFREAISVAKSTSITSFDNLQWLALYVLPTPEDNALGRDPYSDPLRAALRQVFLTYACDVALAQSALENSTPTSTDDPAARVTARREYQTWQMLMPLFAKTLPDKVPVVQARLARLASRLSAVQLNALETSPNSKTVIEELLRKAEASIDSRRKDTFYLQAAMTALQQDDVNRAFSITDRISGAEDRESLKSLILYQASLKSLGKDDVDGAYNYAKEIGSLSQRVIMFNRIAESLLAKKDYARVDGIIDEIWRWIENSGNSPEKAHALLSVVTIVSRYNMGRGFEILQSAVRAVNSADFTPPNESPVNDRLLIRKIPITIDMLDYERSFRPLARSDFERTLLAAQMLNNKEAALLAKIVICQEVLESPPGKPQNNKRETRETESKKPVSTDKPGKPQN